MSSDFEIERRCLFEKKPGIVQLSASHLLWTPDSNADGHGLRLPFTSVKKFQVSKEGSAKKAMIRLMCNDRDDSIILDFARNFRDRDAVRDVLNRLQSTGENAMSSAKQAPVAGSNGSSGGESNSSKQPPVAPPKLVTPEERARRQRLLLRKEVVKLHKRLVRGGAVTDDQFWNAMKYRYKNNGERRTLRSGAGDLDDEDEKAARRTVRGVPSDAFSTGVTVPTDSSKWEGTIPTSSQRHLVFMEHPAVARALKEKVPSEMTEEKFWTHYLRSSMGRRGRRGRGPGGGLSKTETAEAAEADMMFAPFQAREGEAEAVDTARRVAELAPELDIDRFDDHRTAHVLEGHVVGGDAPRPMKKQKGGPASMNLRLMRMVNRHGTLIVDESERGRKNWTDEEGVKGRPLEDLEVEEEPSYAKLGVGASTAAPGQKTRHGNAGVEEGADAVARGIASAVQGWRADFARLEEGIPGSSEILQGLLEKMVP